MPNHQEFHGLSSAEAAHLRKEFGPNTLESHQKNTIWRSIGHIVQEPMFLLLAVACVLYFILGEPSEAIMMLVSILFVVGIELFQENKSERALEALRKYAAPKVKALRDGQWVELDTADLVPGDVVAISEGEHLPADGILLQQNDLSVDESILTGESLAVAKDEPNASILFQGTMVTSGKGVMRVTATGNRTEMGKLGKSIESIEKGETPLQIQISNLVRRMGVVGVVTFLIVLGLNLWLEHDFWKAVLFSLTIAMSLIPEEIPVAFTTFMGLGAYRMVQFGILTKQPKTVESLGSATVICLDKTGTITENKMDIAEVYDISGQNRTLEYALWASEEDPFDAMEKALEAHVCTIQKTNAPRNGWQITKEYALGGTPPMMTHVWKNESGERIVAAKGALERILRVCKTDDATRAQTLARANAMAEKGYRVLGVASSTAPEGYYPAQQDDFPWELEGLVAFFDPPKKNVAHVFNAFYKAGIRVMMITGDHAATALNIARSVGLRGTENAVTGQEIMDMPDEALQETVRHTHVFARMFPEAKLRVVKALQANGEVVAMSGDGVNDGPALKAAQIGVAMGKKGTEVAKNAASLVLLNDHLGGMVTAVKMGRRIYDNLQKAIRYVISIHLPIILTVLVPLLLQWPYPHILLPLHVIFLELVMDPTAAVAFENEPGDKNMMQKPPRPASANLFSGAELAISLIQGAIITMGILLMYQYAVAQGYEEQGVRSFVFATMVFSNVFLTLANRSFERTIWHTIRYKNPMMPAIMAISILMLLAILYVPALATLFKMAPIPAPALGLCLLTGIAGTLWFEGYKFVRGILTTV
jgi:P-type Ca2+ transporter type 2C